jgi:cytosine/adenosine deaminase-related metal-dependent hydrolase
VLAPVYRPQDAYAGNLVSAYGAIDAGITTLLDWSHIQNTPEHTDASIAALQESGLRSVFAYGTPNLDLGAWWHNSSLKHPTDIIRVGQAVLLVEGRAHHAGAGAARARVHDT